MADYAYVLTHRSGALSGIVASITTAVGRAPDSVTKDDSGITVTYGTALTAAEQTALDTWMTANTGLKAK